MTGLFRYGRASAEGGNMIGPLKTLFGRQRRAAEGSADFVARLDPARTVTLADLLADVKRSERLARLRAPWLDAGRFAARVASACAWLDGVARREDVPGWEGVPHVFIQPADAEEDAREHARRCGDATSFYRDRNGHLPPAAMYLHVHTNVFDSLEGDWDARTLRMRPLTNTFSNYRRPFVYDRSFIPRATRGYHVGFALTDLPALLDVGPAVATDFFARIVVHDLCHGFLPRTPFAAEGFHNVAALRAMGTLPPIGYRHLWEGFVHAECADPTFVLRARTEIAAMRKALGTPSPLEEDVLRGYARWYANAEAERKRRELWGLPSGAGPAELFAKIEEARLDGFRLYVRLMSDARLMVDP
jgi:hypothetical protein